MLTSGGKRATQRCPCGYWRTKLRECRCRDGDVVRYRSRISGPLLDRIDLFVDVPSIDVEELRRGPRPESSATVRARVEEARARRERSGDTPLTEDAERTLLKAARNMALSARGISRCVGVARTIASLAGHDTIEESDVGEALQFRVPPASVGAPVP